MLEHSVPTLTANRSGGTRACRLGRPIERPFQHSANRSARSNIRPIETGCSNIGPIETGCSNIGPIGTGCSNICRPIASRGACSNFGRAAVQKEIKINSFSAACRRRERVIINYLKVMNNGRKPCLQKGARVPDLLLQPSPETAAVSAAIKAVAVSSAWPAVW
ncbi:hypothetical protein AOXY_G2412 [Acipenser oxyrinchus oxyrinchus]|uniref:Uncharacterized protein n=1 Tax=Acipenser oxyrinchus oxyrinchus TaxID=40147 RepID=A0AAD8GHQ7_ACIOX|nr:hypothetical protein AOXY_G2412 [Acipenser oxyrinchus oxyrinchus]